MKTLNQHLSEDQLAILPTEEDVAFYKEHGWYISKKVLPEELIDEAILGSARYYRGERDIPLPVKTIYWDWKPENGNIIRNNEFVSLQNRELRKLAFQPIIGAIAARLAQTRQIRLFADSLLGKPPTASDSEHNAIGWHTDKAFWPTCSSDNLLTAWIPLEDCDESMGPLVVLDSSHKWSDTQNLKSFYGQNLENPEQRFRQEGRQVLEVPMTLKKGQVSFHHCRVVHGSYPNYSQSLRLAMAIHLQDNSNHYQCICNTKEEQIDIRYNALCQKLPNGNPDYNDPVIFPVLWSEDV
ncbi:MAG: phytanoyl-CoA dioxygenase family protein [Fischerella sp. CENA71]|nr:phytanoyl-CoA dioxygenase family protein [Fischerella sp. CENA71]